MLRNHIYEMYLQFLSSTCKVTHYSGTWPHPY